MPRRLQVKTDIADFNLFIKVNRLKQLHTRFGGLTVIERLGLFMFAQLMFGVVFRVLLLNMTTVCQQDLTQVFSGVMGKHRATKTVLV